MNIQIYNLSLNTDDRDVRRLFSPFGIVISAEVIKDKLNGRSKRNARVEMPVENEGRLAIESLNETLLDGKKISVTEFKEQPEW